MDKILNVMEDVKQNITDSQYKIIMDSLMEINKEKGQEKKPLYYTQKEFDEMTKVVIKLSIEFFFEYTNDEQDAIWLDSIKRLIESKLFSYNIVLSGDDLEKHILKIFQEKNLMRIGDFIKKIRHRK
jgi:predicted house-cleaning noncanonical NTP pyrophosphatase (MazG superfamily)